jgi:hypothetical protein
MMRAFAEEAPMRSFRVVVLGLVAAFAVLVGDVARGAGGRPARVAMRIFGLLFRLNLTRSPWGWQVLAAAHFRGRQS